MRENDYLPDACPICEFFGTIGEFLKRGDKYHLRLVCPQCGARTDFVESTDEAVDIGYFKCFGELYVIGNVHDNPGLLEAKNARD